MIIKTQKPLYFINTCNCIVDLELLEKAMHWLADSPMIPKRTIYLDAGYPAVTLNRKTTYVHRLIAMYTSGKVLPTEMHVHHKDENVLNANIDNLQIVSVSEHATIHRIGMKYSAEIRAKISAANRKRVGIKMKNRKPLPMAQVKEMLLQGTTIQQIALSLGVAWCLVQKRVKEDPELNSIPRRGKNGKFKPNELSDAQILALGIES